MATEKECLVLRLATLMRTLHFEGFLVQNDTVFNRERMLSSIFILRCISVRDEYVLYFRFTLFYFTEKRKATSTYFDLNAMS